MMRQQRAFSLLSMTALSLTGILLFAGRADAQLTLTAAGTSAGFTLTTFADNFPNSSSVGPLGIAFSGGHVIVTDYPGNVRVFATDTDGQHANTVAPGATYGFSNAVGLATIGNNIYMTGQSSAAVSQINADGTFNQSIVSYSGATGIVANPTNNHLFVSNGGSIIDVDPIAKTFTTFNNAAADGLTTDGTTLYAAVNSHVIGYNIATKAQVFDSGFINSVDGTALGFGSLSGSIFANTNDGRVVQIDLTTLTQTVIATGGSRGDFVTVDPNGTLLITQTDRIMRLTPGNGGTFVETPEPGSVALFLASGLTGLGLLARRRRARK